MKNSKKDNIWDTYATRQKYDEVKIPKLASWGGWGRQGWFRVVVVDGFLNSFNFMPYVLK